MITKEELSYAFRIQSRSETPNTAAWTREWHTVYSTKTEEEAKSIVDDWSRVLVGKSYRIIHGWTQA